MDPYDSGYDPPAPILDVTCSNPFDSTVTSIDGKALIDSGAFKTVIPEDWVARLGLTPVRELETRGYKDEAQKHLAYFVKIAFKEHHFNIEVLAVKRENILLGRDILNKLRLLLDGKSLNFEVTDP